MNSRNSKIKQRNILADRIHKDGVERQNPCSRCLRRGMHCMVSANSSRCGQCVRGGVKCDIVGPSEEDWDRLDEERTKLLAEEKACFAQEQAAFAQRGGIRFSIMQLERKRDEMLRRGLKSIEDTAPTSRDGEDDVESSQICFSSGLTPPHGPVECFNFGSGSFSLHDIFDWHIQAEPLGGSAVQESNLVQL